MPADRPTLWILTDGKAGDEQPLVGVAEAIGVVPELRHVAPRPLFAALMPWGPVDPRERPGRPASPLAPPYPDICLATGRRAVAYLRALKSVSPATVTVFFKDPRTRRHGADLLVLQRHDRAAGAEENALVVTTAPNRIAAQTLERLRHAPPARLAVLPRPRIAVLVGGDSRHHRFTPRDIASFVAGLRKKQEAGAGLMITTSRRTPADLAAALAALAGEANVELWTGAGENPLLAYLALADSVVVTADSTNMIGEAAATGRPLQLFHPSGGHPKTERLIAALSREAHVGRFPDDEATGSYPPVNSTPLIAATILTLRARRARPS